jgi:hypothetical protein
LRPKLEVLIEKREIEKDCLIFESKNRCCINQRIQQKLGGKMEVEEEDDSSDEDFVG